MKYEMRFDFSCFWMHTQIEALRCCANSGTYFIQLIRMSKVIMKNMRPRKLSWLRFCAIFGRFCLFHVLNEAYVGFPKKILGIQSLLFRNVRYRFCSRNNMFIF